MAFWLTIVAVVWLIIGLVISVFCDWVIAKGAAKRVPWRDSFIFGLCWPHTVWLILKAFR